MLVEYQDIVGVASATISIASPLKRSFCAAKLGVEGAAQ